MIYLSVLLIGSLVAVSGENKTDLAEYPDLFGGNNSTEITEIISLNPEDDVHEETQEESLENDAPIDAGRRKGKKYWQAHGESYLKKRNLRNCERTDLYLYILEFVSSVAFLKVTRKYPT